MPRTVTRRPWWPLLPLLALGAEDPAPSKLSFFGSAKDEAAPSKLSFFGSASAGDARRQEDGQDSKRAAAAAADAPKRPFFGSASAKQAREQEEPVLSDLQPEAEQEDEEVPSIFDSVNHPPPGFHRDPAGSTVAAGHHHTCALRQSSAPFGGIAHCWGEDTMGAVSRVPVELTFIQLSSGHFHSCGITLDEKLVCWGGPNPKRFEPPGLYQQVSCGAVHTCGLRKDCQVKCWFFGRRPFFLPSYAITATARRRTPSSGRGDGVGRQKKRTPTKEPALDLAVLPQPTSMDRAARHLLIQPGRLEAFWIGTAPAHQFFIQRNAAGVEMTT